MPRIAKLFVTTVFIAGCVTGVIAREVFGVPTATAQTSAERFDYFCFASDDPSDVQTKLKSAGLQGWELVTTTGTFWCMKRRLY